MIAIGPATRIFLAAGATDMRKGYNGLCDLVSHQLEEQPLSGNLFVFGNRRRDRIKILYWDGSGLWLCSKKLEKGRFSWPNAEEVSGKVHLSGEQLSLLLGGIELERTRHKRGWWRKAAA